MYADGSIRIVGSQDSGLNRFEFASFGFRVFNFAFGVWKSAF